MLAKNAIAEDIDDRWFSMDVILSYRSMLMFLVTFRGRRAPLT